MTRGISMAQEYYVEQVCGSLADGLLFGEVRVCWIDDICHAY